MRTEKSHGTLTIYLEGDIGHSNTAEWELNLKKAVTKTPCDVFNIEINAASLNSLTPPAARAIKRACESKKEHTCFTEVSEKLFPLFESEELTKHFKIKKTPTDISIKNNEYLTTDGYGEIYRTSNDTLVKLYSEKIPETFIESEYNKIKKAVECGIPAALPAERIRSGNREGFLYRISNAKTMYELLHQDPADKDCIISSAAPAGKELGKLFRKLHDKTNVNALPGSDKKKSLSSWVNGFIDFLQYDDLLLINDLINDIPESGRFVFGGFDLGSIIISDNSIQLINMMDAGYGHPVIDLADAMAHLHILPGIPDAPENKKISRNLCTVSIGRTVWEEFSAAYFEEYDNEKIKNLIRNLKPYGTLAAACRLSEFIGHHEIKKNEKIAKYIKDEVIGSILRYRGKGSVLWEHTAS